MSELKHQLMLNKEMSWVPCYIKSEADKVIEEKDAEIARLKAIRKVHVEAIESMGAGLLQDEEEIRHQKYKRCLAMVDKCAEIAKKYYYLICLESSHNPKYDRFPKKMDLWEKWGQRWLELAEKFKEAK